MLDMQPPAPAHDGCTIAVIHGAKVKAIRCDLDGEPENAGKLLHQHFKSGPANHLVALGNLYSLGRRIVPVMGELHDLISPAPNMCIFWERDVKEPNQGWQLYWSIENMVSAEQQKHNYIMVDSEWIYVNNTGTESTITPLSEYLAGIE